MLCSLHDGDLESLEPRIIYIKLYLERAVLARSGS